MNNPTLQLMLAGLAGLSAFPVMAQSRQDAPGHSVQVTATRFGDAVQELPLPITVVTGDELRARGATDLRTALAGVAGVTVAPGGDAGPAGAVPGLLGPREADDLLLLIDGVPAGGAFVPSFETLSLVNVARIEILRGTAPVYFGTTAFAGTINVIHYAAGQAEQVASLRYGSHGSVGASASAVLSNQGFRQSVSAELSQDKQADRHAQAQRGQINWRGATDLAGGGLRVDVALLGLRQKPASPVPVDERGQLSTVVPIDFNQNPADARLDTDRAQLVLGYELPLSFGRWGSTLSYTDSSTHSVRGFIDAEDSPPPWTAQTLVDLEAFNQHLKMRDLFVDSHLSLQPMAGLDLTAGFNLLSGQAHAHSLRHALKLPLDGASRAPATNTVAAKTDVDLNIRRRFVGLYTQARYRLSPNTTLLGGLRWNDTHETRVENRLTTSSGALVRYDDRQDIRRLSGSFGLQWAAWRSAQGLLNDLTLHASVGNTFQPAQIDFTPNPEAHADGGGLLKPETQRSLVLGLRADAWNGLAELDLEGFVIDFDRQPVGATVAQTAVLRATGRQRYRGLDLEAKLHPAAHWTVSANVGYSAVRYGDYLTDIGGVPTQLRGKQLSLTPKLRAAAGVVYAPARGWRGSLSTAVTGKRWLDSLNTVSTPAYTVLDASIGYRFDRATLMLAASNLGDRRDPVQTSELGEGQFYRLPGRSVTASLMYSL